MAKKEEKHMPNNRSDFIAEVIGMRGGRVYADINLKANEVIDAVIENGGKGKLMVTFDFKAERSEDGCIVEVSTGHELKIKKPDKHIGRSLFFVGRDGRLTTVDPAQTEMFEDAPAETREDSKRGIQ